MARPQFSRKSTGFQVRDKRTRKRLAVRNGWGLKASDKRPGNLALSLCKAFADGRYQRVQDLRPVVCDVANGVSYQYPKALPHRLKTTCPEDRTLPVATFGRDRMASQTDNQPSTGKRILVNPERFRVCDGSADKTRPPVRGAVIADTVSCPARYRVCDSETLALLQNKGQSESARTVAAKQVP